MPDTQLASDVGVLSLLPPALTLALALATRNILLALFLGGLSGTLLLTGGRPDLALLTLVEDHLFVQVAEPFNAQIMFTMMAIGGFIHLLQESGGATAFARHMVGSIRDAKGAQVSAWGAGLGIFFSDVGNPLIVGPLFRPIFDGLHIAREKLAYVLDCTSSPVCILIPFIGWGTYISGLIEQGYTQLGRSGDGFATLLEVLPYQYYALLTLLAVPLFAWRGRDLGPMRIAQQRAEQKTAQPTTQNAAPAAPETVSKAESIALFAVPIGILLGLIGALLGGYAYYGALTSVHVRSTLFISYLAAALACALLMQRTQNVSFGDIVGLFIKGAESMVYVCGILVLAWSLGAIINELGTGDYLAALVRGTLPPFTLPAIAFVLAAVTSFATGSSWGTFAIVLVIALPVAGALDASLVLTVAAVLSGGLFGDHTSPISDTTVLASMGADCEHVDHVTTQLPYALLVGGVTFVAYLIVALSPGHWVLPVAAAALVAAIWVATGRQPAN